MLPCRSDRVQPKPPVLVLTARRAPVGSTIELVLAPVDGVILAMTSDEPT